MTYDTTSPVTCNSYDTALALVRMGNYSAALPVMQESLAGLQLELGKCYPGVLLQMRRIMAMRRGQLANVHAKLDDHAAARVLREEAAAVLWRHDPDDEHTIIAISSLGLCLCAVGAARAGRALLEDATTTARRVLGEAHPSTQRSRVLTARATQGCRVDAHACGTLVGFGLRRRPLNGSKAIVVGIGLTTYIVHLPYVSSTCGAQIRIHRYAKIKAVNIIFRNGTAVIVEGLVAAPEWNGQRGIVQHYDEETGRYQLLIKGRKPTLNVKLDRCRLDSVMNEEPEPEPEEIEPKPEPDWTQPEV